MYSYPCQFFKSEIYWCCSTGILDTVISFNSLTRSLYLCVPSDCKATSLKLVIRGHELCEYDYQYVLQDSLQTKLGQRKARKDLLRIELKLVDYPGCY